ncbi:MAG: NAD(P)-dependent oxidoreductase [Chloroflexota bacterium]
MKTSAYFVGVGGARSVDEDAIAAALKNAKLRGAAFDSYALEPVHRKNPLLWLAQTGYNVLLTPHTAAVGAPDDTARRFDNIRRHISHEPLTNQVV